MYYLGAELLATDPHRSDSIPEGQQLDETAIDPGTGPRAYDIPEPQPARVRAFEILCTDLYQVSVVREFVLAREGRLKPFWLPSWQRDLALASAAGSGSSTITIKECGYAMHLWPAGTARRHLALRSPAGDLLTRYVSAAVSNGDGTETLTLIGPAGETTLGLAVDTSWLVMFLRYVRLDADEISFEWSGDLCRISLPVRDLSAEVPA